MNDVGIPTVLLLLRQNHWAQTDVSPLAMTALVTHRIIYHYLV